MHTHAHTHFETDRSFMSVSGIEMDPTRMKKGADQDLNRYVLLGLTQKVCVCMCMYVCVRVYASGSVCLLCLCLCVCVVYV